MATEMTYVTVPDQDGLIDFQQAEAVEIECVRFVRERTCEMLHVKSGTFNDLYQFTCCGGIWDEPRCGEPYATELPGTWCPFCGARVVG